MIIIAVVIINLKALFGSYSMYVRENSLEKQEYSFLRRLYSSGYQDLVAKYTLLIFQKQCITLCTYIVPMHAKHFALHVFVDAILSSS